MKLLLLSFTFFLSSLLSSADPTDGNQPDSCPTSRRLLLFGGFPFSLLEKKSEPISSSSKSSKSARSDDSHGPIVYIRPQTSSELGHKIRSYSHLLKSKLYTQEERTKMKKRQAEKRKAVMLARAAKKKNSTQPTPTKTRELIPIDDQERDRCRALLQIDQEKGLVPVKEIKKSQKNVSKPSKKKSSKTDEPAPVKEKTKSKKVKPSKSKPEPSSKEKTPTKKKKEKKSDETEKPLPSPPVKEPVKAKSPTTSSPPPTTSSSSNSKSKRDNPPVIVEEPVDTNEFDIDEKNNSVVGRAYHFVKNIFQLSDDILDSNHTRDDETIVVTNNEQKHHQTRKLLSLNHWHSKFFDLYFHDFEEPSLRVPAVDDDLSFATSRLAKRQLLSVKTSKRATPVKSTSNAKEKRGHAADSKPKVGWAYRYRISRFLADKKGKRSGVQPKRGSASNAKLSKRKLLEVESDGETNSSDMSDDQERVASVSITQNFVPKRQLLGAKVSEKAKEAAKKEKVVESSNDDDLEEDDDDDDEEKMLERRRIKSYEELTDPAAIVHSYDRGLFKPRVGWQFRYRVSRYIDSLRENIREDQQRLKLGLQAIKRKTPQELSGRRKRVLDKPFEPEPEAPVEENKPNVGWRYRYRISKMLEAKRRGDYVDDEEEKRKARLGPKGKVGATGKPLDDDDECIEWEHDLDPELRKVNEEGKRVGWAYRYRIRRKLDDLKRRQAETGVAFDLETLGGGGGKREKKTATPTTSSTSKDEEKAEGTEKKVVGWQYRYRVSKMLEAQKREGADRATKASSKKVDQLPPHERLDPELARLTPEQRVVGWAYRYRIRRKLDSIKNVTRESDAGKRSKKPSDPSQPRTTSKRKHKEKIIKQVEESIEKILNIDDIDETPFMEYFRRTSSYVIFGLVPTARKSICLLPLPVNLAFCNEDADQSTQASASTAKTTTSTTTSTAAPPANRKSAKKVRVNKAKAAPSRPTKAISSAEEKTQKKPQRERIRPPSRRPTNEQVKHFDEEEQPIKKRIGVESTKRKNKKQFQIIGQEVKVKPKTSTPTTTTTAPPPPPPSHPPTVATTTTTPSPPILTTTTTTPSPPIVEILTTPAPLSAVIQDEEEASTLLSSASTFPDEANEEIAENLPPVTTTTTAAPVPVDDDTSSTDDDDTDDDEDDDSSSSSGSETDSDQEETEERKENFDPLALKKIKNLYESAKESVHDVFDLKDEKNSS